LVSVYEQSSTQRLSLLMTDFFKLQLDTQMNVTAYVARFEMQFSEYRAASTRVAKITD